MVAVPAVQRPVVAREAMVRCVQRAVRARPDAVLVDVRRAVGPRFVGDAATTGAASFHPSALRYGLIADVLAPAVVAAVSDGSRPERSRLWLPRLLRPNLTQRLLTAHGCERRS